MKKFLFLFCWVLAACETIVEIEVPFDQPAMTLNSLFNPDSTITATLSLNRHVLDDTPFLPVIDASVTLYEDGNLVGALTGEEGQYASTFQPSPGHTYRVEATFPTLNPIFAECALPVPVPLTAADLSEQRVDDRVETSVRIKFHDEATVGNYYQVVAFITRDGYDHQNNTVVPTTSLVWLDYTNLLEAFDGDDPSSGILLSDESFNGKEVDFVVRFHGSLESAAKLDVVLRSLSPECFKYLTTANLQDQTADNPFAQPVNVFGNIQNGYGIFAGYSQSVRSWTTPPPVIHSVEPNEGRPGDVITITGENLPHTSIHNAGVTFRAWYGTTHPSEVVAHTPTSVSVRVPQQAVTGKIHVNYHGRIVISTSDFIVLD